MNNEFQIYKVLDSLPLALEPNSVYLVKIDAGFDFYVSDVDGNVAYKVNGPSRLVSTLEVQCAPEQISTGSITLAKSALLVSISISQPSWFVLYNSESARASDLLRLITVDPLPASGVMLEINNSSSGAIILTPPPIITSANSTNSYPFRITNKGLDTTLTITLNYVNLET